MCRTVSVRARSSAFIATYSFRILDRLRPGRDGAIELSDWVASSAKAAALRTKPSWRRYSRTTKATSAELTREGASLEGRASIATRRAVVVVACGGWGFTGLLKKIDRNLVPTVNALQCTI